MKFESYNRPGNCPDVVVPTVNREIWDPLSPGARKSDIKLQHVQRSVIKAAVAVSRVADWLIAEHGEKEQALRQSLDAISLLGHASREISLRRRIAIRPHLNENIAKICHDSVLITDSLFGDNLPATPKELHKLNAELVPEKKHVSGNRHYDGGKKGSFFGDSRQYKNNNWGHRGHQGQKGHLSNRGGRGGQHGPSHSQ